MEMVMSLFLLMPQRTWYEGDDGDGASTRCEIDKREDVAEEEGGSGVSPDVVVLRCSYVCAFYECRTWRSAFDE